MHILKNKSYVISGLLQLTKTKTTKTKNIFATWNKINVNWNKNYKKYFISSRCKGIIFIFI